MREVWTAAFSLFRTYRFENLLPGSVYTVEVSSVSGDRRSLPASAIANTRECYYTDILVQDLARTYRLLSLILALFQNLVPCCIAYIDSRPLR